MKKTGVIFLFVLGIAIAAFAHEPQNIAINKQQLRHYHDSGTYQNDIANVMQKALRYLEWRVKKENFQGYKPAIVLDIDETALSNYHDMNKRDFGGSMKEIQLDEIKGHDQVIAPTLKLYRFAKKNHVAVFFVTGRFEEERIPTAANLKAAGFNNYDGLILRDGRYREASATDYKKAIRKQLYGNGYRVILNIGDQTSDLRGGYADKTFKLPNPYYYIP